MAEPQLFEEQRENWGSRAGFILAAIGSAVGLGNLWGFPYKLYSYGGGAFLIPYILGMLIIGVPVLILEFSLGHMAQRAAPDAFRRAGRRKEFVGWWGIALGFVIITYYPVILAYCLSFLWYSFDGIINHGGEVPWSGKGPEAVAQTKAFFNEFFLNKWGEGEAGQSWWFGSLSPKIVLSLGIVWMLMFLCIVRGVKLVSKVVLWTVPLPWLMLLILTVRGLTLEGSTQGLAFYLNPDWEQLLKPTTWRFAFGQVFFSMSLAFGVMLTYASFLHRKSDINNNAAIIGLGDLGTSFIAGIAVFATLGAMSFATGVKVDEVGAAGPDLCFITFPYALAQIPYGAWFAALFFIALLTLGIDSAFSITESVLASIVDKTGWNRSAVLWAMTFIGFAMGLVYCGRSGLGWLFAIDGFINGPWGIALLGMLECIVLGWMFRLSRLRNHANERSDWRLGPWWDWNIRLVVPVVISALFIWSLFDTVTARSGWIFTPDGALNLPNFVGLILAILAPVLSIWMATRRFGRAAPQHLVPPPGQEPQGADQSSTLLGAILPFVGFLLVAWIALVAIRTKLLTNADVDLPDGLAMGHSRWLVLVVLLAAGLLAIFGIVQGIRSVGRAERDGCRPHWTSQAAGALGVFDLGCALGLGLAVFVMLRQIEPTTVKHTTEMSGWAYAIMATMLGLMVVGLGWCFYRAIKAASDTSPEEEQVAEV